MDVQQEQLINNFVYVVYSPSWIKLSAKMSLILMEPPEGFKGTFAVPDRSLVTLNHRKIAATVTVCQNV